MATRTGFYCICWGTIIDLLFCCVVLLMTLVTASAQDITDDFILVPEGSPIREVPFRGKPILVHLRVGYERAIAFPEPVSLTSSVDPALPGCQVRIDRDLVGFYPSKDFTRRVFTLTGQSGTRYELSIRASKEGMSNTLKLIESAEAI